MKHRVIGAALFGIGVLLIVFAVGLRTHVTPAVSKLPYDLKASTTVAEAENATFLQVRAGDIAINTGVGLRSQTDIVPEAQLTEELEGDLDGKAVVWSAYSTVSRVDNEQGISAYSTQLALDRASGEALQWHGTWLDEGNLGAAADGTKLIYEGQVYKFPFHTQKKTYDFWDSKIRGTAPATFVRVEDVNGLEAYRFEQRVERQEIPKPAAATLKALLAKLAPGATDATMYYSTTRILWVEPTTGIVLNRLEQPRQELEASDGSKHVLLSADFNYTEETVKKAVDNATESKGKLLLISLYVPLGVGILGLILIVAALIVISRAGRSARQSRQYDDTLTYENV